MKPFPVVLLTPLLAIAAGPQSDGWTPLFDGKTLQGWHVAAKPEDLQKAYWSVRDGAITCDSRGKSKHDYVWLVSDGEYSDFDLKLKVRSFRESKGNSGVQIRSRYDSQAYYLDGPQVDIHPPAPFRSGLIYDETRGVRHWIYPVLPDWKIEPEQGPKQWTWKHSDEGDGWNDVWIECRGAKIRTSVNGIRIADYDGSGVLDDEVHRQHNVGMRGHIALQLHSRDDLYIQYRDIVIRRTSTR